MKFEIIKVKMSNLDYYHPIKYLKDYDWNKFLHSPFFTEIKTETALLSEPDTDKITNWLKV